MYPYQTYRKQKSLRKTQRDSIANQMLINILFSTFKFVILISLVCKYLYKKYRVKKFEIVFFLKCQGQYMYYMSMLT